MTDYEYLVSHGNSGGFGRFASETPLTCRRGQRVVVHSARGLELGTILCPTNGRQQRLLQSTPVGRLLRLATDEDERQADERQILSQELFAQALALTDQFALPIEIVDVEILLDGEQAILQHLAHNDSGLEDFVQALEGQYRLKVLLENLAQPLPVEEEEHGGCGQPGCGRTDGGGCSTCGSGGGCSSCGSGKADLRPYFAHLRTQMEENHQRTSLH